MAPVLPTDEYVDGLRWGDRTMLARAITLIESRRADHRVRAAEVLDAVMPLTGRAQRVGITGVPGVGKSTFIDQFGTNLTAEGRRVAVLAVDPTSQRTGGSILGDKTRMERLSIDPAAFVRPSPAGTTLGGVTRTTREAMLLCEAANFDVVLVETVGVGQSETIVADMVDFFLVLMLSGAGDELQGIKKGVLELADAVAVNKADGDNEIRARAAAAEYRHALHLLSPTSAVWTPPVLTCSALADVGLVEIWAQIRHHREVTQASGEFDTRRQAQQVRWMWSMIESRVMDDFRSADAVVALLGDIEQSVRSGSMAASAAADRLLAAFEAKSPKDREMS